MKGLADKFISLNNGVVHLGLDRMYRLLPLAGFDADRLKIIHIAGTNGKGSVAEYITRILLAAGKSVGTFTSPFALDYCEQFRIDGVPVGRGVLEELLIKTQSLVPEATPFEVETAACLSLFCERNAEYAVIECGMGGLTDATNAVGKKELALITSVSLEHTAYLGDTIESICAHKAGIANGCHAIVSAYQPPEAREYFRRAGFCFADGELVILGGQSGFQRFLYRGEEYRIRMNGAAQPYNAALAIEAAEYLGIDRGAICRGLEEAYLAGRTELIEKDGRTFILDGAHNPASMKNLAEYIRENFIRVDDVIYGCLSDKDIYGSLEKLNGCCRRITAVRPNSPRAMDIEKIYGACAEMFGCAYRAYSVAEALEKSGKTVAVCGSFTLIKEAFKWIEKGS